MAYQFSQTGAEIQAILNNAEDKTNKVTAISSASTDTQYASAKCLYDNFMYAMGVVDGKANKATNSLNFGIGRDANGFYMEIEG